MRNKPFVSPRGASLFLSTGGNRPALSPHPGPRRPGEGGAGLRGGLLPQPSARGGRSISPEAAPPFSLSRRERAGVRGKQSFAPNACASRTLRPPPRSGCVLRCLLALALASVGAHVAAQETPIAFVGARIITVSGDDIDGGVLVVEAGKIKSVEPAGTTVPPGAVVRRLEGKVIMPGLIDTHSHIGGVPTGEPSAPIQPELRVLDAFDVRDPTVHKARAGGITTANVMSGSGLLCSGQTVYLKLRDGESIDDLLITNKYGRVAGGLKMANGTNSRREPPFPGTRAKSAALVREKFIAAMEYRDKIERAKGDVEKVPARDLALESLVEVLSGERIVQHHTHRHDDILTVLRLQKEFGFRVVLHHVSDAWKVVDEIAAAKVPCSVIVVDSPGGKIEARDIDFKRSEERRVG